MAISKTGKTSIFFVVPNTKVNVKYYGNVLLKKMIPEVNRLAKHNEYLFMQDGAKAHTAKLKRQETIQVTGALSLSTEQLRFESSRFLRIWSHLLKKYLMDGFIFCAVVSINGSHNLSKKILGERRYSKFFEPILVHVLFLCSLKMSFVIISGGIEMQH